MTLKSLLTLSICLTAMCHCALSKASLTIVPILGGGPVAGANYVNFDDLPAGSGTTYSIAGSAIVGDDVAVNLTPNAKAVIGSSSGEYAAPWVTSATNGLVFGNLQADGDDLTQYITTGSTGSTSGAQAELVFSAPQSYFGLLWGSVDSYNTLTFYDAADMIVGTIVGTQVTAAATGDQGPNGTFYVNIDSSVPFTRVVATSTEFAFEFDNVAYSANRIVPEATTIAIWSTLGAIGFLAYRRRQLA